MKKTQSLKLMLLGVFSLVSTGVWAQFTQVNGVVYDVRGDKAKVVGVLSALPDGAYGDGRYLPGTKSIQIEDAVDGKKVDGLAANWMNSGKFANTTTGTLSGNVESTVTNADGTQTVTVSNGGGNTSTTVYPTIDATTLAAVELLFKASEITKISRDDIKGLKVAGFILGSTSGITEIPENLFAPVKTVTEIPNDAKTEEIARLNDLINGSTQYYAPKGIFGSQQVYESSNVPGFYFVVNANEQTQLNGEFVNSAYQISQEEGKEPKVAESKYVWVRIDQETGNLIAANGNGWQNNYATPVTTDLFPYGVKGLKTIAQEKSDAYAKYEGEAPNQTLVSGALKDYLDAQEATIQAAAALADETYGYDADAVLKSTKAQALINAINAFSGDATKWGLLQAHIATDLLNSVTLPDEWYVAYVLATTDNWATEMPSLTDADKAYVGNKTSGLVKDVIDAYVAYFGYAPQALQKTEVPGYKFTSYAAAGNIFKNMDGATSENLHQLATGIVEDRSIDTADPYAVVTMGDEKYFKVKVLQNSVDAANWEGKAFYVQLPENKSIVTDTYYVLYEYKKVEDIMQMVPVTFETSVVTTPGTPGQSGQLTAVYTALETPVDGTIGNIAGKLGEKTVVGLKVSEVTTLVAKRYVKVGDDLIPVTTLYTVKGEGDAWNGRYFVDANGKLYKQTAEDWTDSTTESGARYMVSEAVMGNIPGTADATTNATATIVVNINPTPETYEYTLSPKDQKPSIDAADPRPELATQVITYPSDTERRTAYDNAVADEAAKKTAAEQAETAMNTANGELKHAQDDLANVKENKDGNWPDTLSGDLYDKDGKNDNLYQVTFYNDIVSVEDHAFALCEKAKFTGTFKSKLVKIGKEAFLNTLFENLDLSNTGKKDWRGGDPDEDGNPTPDGKTDIKDRLTGVDIAVDAFVGTPMVSMNLSTTNVGDGWVYSVVRNIKFEEPNTVEYTDACGNTETYDMPVNKTLTTVVLPTGEGEDELDFDRIQGRANGNTIGTFENCIKLVTIDIPAQVYQIEPYAFNNCVALATITFATEKAELQRIGSYAFYGTAAATIDLSKQTLLGVTTVPATAQWAEQAWSVPVGIGDYAFAAMPNLTSVNFTNTQLTTLQENVFLGSVNLQTVTFFDATDPKSESTIATLPEGLFKSNFAITALDLSKTKITVLNNLFQARPEKATVVDCAGNETQKGLWNEALTSFTLPENLKEIKPFALSSLWGLTYSKADPFIIPGSVNKIGEGAFMNDKNLVAVKAMDSELTSLPQHTFASCTSLEEVTLVTLETLLPVAFGDKCFFSTKTPDVYVNNDSYELLGANFFEGSYATLKPYAPVIQTIQLGNLYFKPWTSKYGTWIEATKNVGVYTAYQNGSKIALYPAKKSTFVGKDGKRKDYYKIAAYDKDATGFSYTPSSGGAAVTKPAPAQIDYLMSSRMTFNRKGMYGEISPTVVDGLPTMPMLQYSDNFSDEVLAKTWLALGAAIIVSNLSDDIPYIQKTNAWQKYQSTLDLANQLVVAKNDIPADNNTNFYYLAEQDGTYKFIHHNDETAVPFIPEDAVVFMQDAELGHLGLARTIDIEFVNEGEATAINGVVERSLNDSEAIFNVQGIRVIAPVKGQMYIQGGKKFIQK